MYKRPRWLNNVFLFSTEIWAEQLKNTLYLIKILFFEHVTLSFFCIVLTNSHILIYVGEISFNY